MMYMIQAADELKDALLLEELCSAFAQSQLPPGQRFPVEVCLL